MSDRVYVRTSLRLFTVYPGGSVPSLSMRMGQRVQRGLSEQHFFLGLGTRCMLGHQVRVT